MATHWHKKKAVTRASAELRPDQCLKVRPRLGQISCPTLVIVGEEDMALPVPLSRRLASGIRGAELLVVPRVGHLSTVEAPALLTQAIERFVDPFALESQRAA